MRMDTEINCSSPRRNNQLNPNKYNMVIAKYTVIKLHNATHDTNMEKGPLKKKMASWYETDLLVISSKHRALKMYILTGARSLYI